MQKPSTRSKSLHIGWIVYGVLVLLRFLLIILVQPGYLHPDEFFQSVEIGAGDVYGLRVFRSWEFVVSEKGPVRSIAGLAPLVHFPLWVSKQFLSPTRETVNGTDYSLLNGGELISRILLPLRLHTALYSLTVDAFILVASVQFLRSNRATRGCLFSTAPPLALLLYASSAFGGLLLAGRTLANTWEMAAVSTFSLLALSVMCSDLRSRRSRFILTGILCAQAVLCAWATFVRTTFLLFISPLALAEICTLLYRYKRSILLPGTVAVLLLAITVQACLHVDTVYFNGADPFAWLSPSELICTPCRFVQYNSRPEHLSEHGLHPSYLHLLVNMPMIFGPVVGFLALWPPTAFRSRQTLLWVSVLLPLVFLSSVPHQEARFLLPIVPLVLTLSGRRIERAMCGASGCKRILIYGLLFAWVLQQACLTLLFGWFHQGGVITYLRSLPSAFGRDEADLCPVHVFYHTYMPPRFSLGRPITSDGPCGDLIDLGGSLLSRLEDTLTQLRLKATQDVNRTWAVHLVYPGSLAPLNLSFARWGTEVTSTAAHFGHLSFEDPPTLWPALKQLSPSIPQLLTTLQELQSQLSIHLTTIRLR